MNDLLVQLFVTPYASPKKKGNLSEPYAMSAGRRGNIRPESHQRIIPKHVLVALSLAMGGVYSTMRLSKLCTSDQLGQSPRKCNGRENSISYHVRTI